MPEVDVMGNPTGGTMDISPPTTSVDTSAAATTTPADTSATTTTPADATADTATPADATASDGATPTDEKKKDETDCTTCADEKKKKKPEFDDRTGPSGLWSEMKDTQPSIAARAANLQAIDKGELVPDPGSRLGAYAATAGYEPGTVGSAAHRAIGGIYMGFGTFGEERIGTVFNSPEAGALFGQSVNGPASGQLAQLEYNYWDAARTADPWSPGGQMGSAFSPGVRDTIQQGFGNAPLPDWTQMPSLPRDTFPFASPPARDGGAYGGLGF